MSMAVGIGRNPNRAARQPSAGGATASVGIMPFAIDRQSAALLWTTDPQTFGIHSGAQ